MRDSSAVYSADHYVQRLDLGADPFEKGYRSDYFFGGGQRSQVLDQALHFSRYSEQTVLLLGSTGSGTSTILQQVVHRLSPIMDFCTIDGEGVATPTQLLMSLSGQMQLDEACSISSIVSSLQYRAESESGGDPLLLAVDQAHFLSIECLDTLRQLKLQAGNDLHLVLAGEYQVEQLTQLAGFDVAQLKILELEPLSASEIGDYILGVLQSVGYAGEQPLTADQLAVLHEQSGGNITEINLLTPTLLSVRKKNGSLALSMSIPLPHMAAIAVLVMAIAISFWFQGDGDSPAGSPDNAVVASAPDTESVQARQQQPLALELGTNREAPKPVADSGDAAPARDAVTPPEDAVAAPENAVAPAENAVALPEAEAKTQSDAGSTAQTSLTGAIERKPVASPQPAATATTTAESVAPPKPAPAPEKSVAQPQAPATAPQPVKKPAPAQPVAVHTNQTSPAKSLPSAPKVTKPVPAPAAESPVATTLSPREQHLLEMDDSAFLLQLMGASEEARARGLVKTYVGQLPITYFEARRQGQPWYVVVTGPYASKEAAREGVAALPARLRAQQPWVRSVAGVQQEIRELHP